MSDRALDEDLRMSDRALDEEFDDIKEEALREERIRERREERKRSFPPMSADELAEVLGLTIKEDKTNKVVTFLCYLAAYTEDSQFNILFNAPSSAGKTYIALEVASLFPVGDVIDRGYCSSKSFFHCPSSYDPEKEGYLINLERKILIFLDQPHPHLLEHMRPLFSHDKKEIRIMITDKTQKKGLKTKSIILRGFPSVVFCTAGLKLDEQEATRFILLSPETTTQKIADGVLEAAKKGADRESYFAALNSDPDRQLLIHRIKAVKEEAITCVKIPNPKLLAERFLARYRPLKPRHQRDIKRLMSLAQSHALLNLWHRLPGANLKEIIASKEDVEAAFAIWDELARSQELHLPPYILALFDEVILPLHAEKERGLKRTEICQHHKKVYGRTLDPQALGRNIIPLLEQAGLVYQENDHDDRRTKLVFPITNGDLCPPQSEK